MVLRPVSKRQPPKKSTAKDNSWNAPRQREADVSERDGFEKHFHFNYGGGDWMRATSLQPVFLSVDSRSIEVKIYRGNDKVPYDAGRFVVDIENKTVIAEGFTRCFQNILGETVKGIAASHLDARDKIILDGVVNGGYERARKCAERGNLAILSISRPRAKALAV